MNCQKVLTYLTAYSEGSLSSEKSHDLEAHIRNCKRCEREMALHEQLLAAAKTLPEKKLPEDFNLQLMNRIYAEQARPSESYLPTKAPTFWGRQFKWASALATVAVCALATIFVLDKTQTPVEDGSRVPAYTEANGVEQVVPVAARQSSQRLHNYDDLIGVSGPGTSYRSTNLEALRAFQINKAQIESLYVAAQERMGRPVIPAQYRTSFRNAGTTMMPAGRNNSGFRYQQATQKQ